MNIQNTVYLLAIEQMWKTGRVVGLDEKGFLVIKGETVRQAPKKVLFRWKA